MIPGMTEGYVRIPEPPGWPIFGNALDFDPNFPLGTLLKYAEQYGEIFRIKLPGRQVIVVTTQALVHELCNESRFEKAIGGALIEVRNGVHDGLFTAHNSEPNWGLAHRILVPAFGPLPIQNMFPEMHEIATQLALKWARHGPNVPIMVTDDFTRLTLDTLALCSMNFRFNSFYHDEMHPFINAMGSFLTESGVRSQQPRFVTALKRSTNQKYWDDIETLRKTAESVLKARKDQPSGRKDLLSAMLDGVDPKTGRKLSDDSIIDNLITFLIAGHETTSGMLSFVFYQLLKQPDKYRKAQEEVDNVVGTGPIKAEHMNKLPYITAVLRESLRLNPTITMYGVTPLKDEILGGKYVVNKGEGVLLLLAKMHLDPRVYGETASEFIPERMLDENFERLTKEFPDCWKPFGNGMRGCIGRPFAWQEALVVMAMLLQNFDFELDDPDYELQCKQTLTVKPKGLYIRASLRNGMTPTDLGHRVSGNATEQNGAPKGASSLPKNGKSRGSGKPMSIFYGSNTGTCEALAQRLAADAPLHGYDANIVDPMDAARGKIPRGQPVVILTASFEGQPPDNAADFVQWLESLSGDEMKDVSYTVFGCGHHDWVQTFHRIPKLVDSTLEARGGIRVCEMGLADAAQGQIFTDFEQWEDDIFWPAMDERYGATEEGDGEALFAPSLSVKFSTPRSSALRQDVKEAVVVDARSLTGSSDREKRHIEIQLPAGMSYRTGDYFAVLPINPGNNVNRVMRRFHLAWDSNITIEVDGRTTLPTNTPMPVHDILSLYVELAQPATKRSIGLLSECATDNATKHTLLSLIVDYTAQITRKRVSLLDLLEQLPSIPLPFATFLSLLPPLRTRTYSISSSPLVNPSRATLTYSLLSEPSLSNSALKFTGVASSYLASLTPGDKVLVSVKASAAAFHLPEEQGKTPIVMIAAGAGVAPFRGFIQERAAQIAAGHKLADAVLVFGCRGPGKEGGDLYRQELDQWEKMGAVSVKRAYSRAQVVEGVEGETKRCRYVQDRIWEEREELADLWERGTKIYVCGSRAVGEEAKKAVIKVAMGASKEGAEEGAEEGEWEEREKKAMKWFEGIRGSRYAADVFD